VSALLSGLEGYELLDFTNISKKVCKPIEAYTLFYFKDAGQTHQNNLPSILLSVELLSF